MSPRKAQAVKPGDKDENKSSQNGPDPIIVTPVNPYLPRFPAGMPHMMMPGQIPFPHPAMHEQPPMNAKRRRTESGKENLDEKSPSTSLPQMPFYHPVSVSMPVPRLVPPPPFQSLPEQDEPCDLSMPKKRKHEGHSEERLVIKERKHDNSHLPHLRSVHGSKHKSIGDYPPELLNHRTQRMDERHHSLHHSRVPTAPLPPAGEYPKLHSPVKMTPRPRGSITQGVINPPMNSIAKAHRETSLSSPLSNSHVKREVPSHIPHTSSISSLPSDHQGKGQMLLPEFPNPHLLAAAAASGFPPRFPLPLVPPHLLSPSQLLAGLPPHLQLNHEELLRRGAGTFVVPQLRFPPPGLVGGGLSPSPVKKEGQHVFAFQG